MSKPTPVAAVLAFPLLLAVAAGADSIRPPKFDGPTPAKRVVRPERSAVSTRVSDLTSPHLVPPNMVVEMLNDLDQEEEKQRVDFGVTPSPDGALQTSAPNAMPAPIQNFQGVSQATQGAVSGFFVSPPDTDGDVGPNHYVQCVNLACQVFNKNGTPAGAVFKTSTLFNALGGECAATNDGDPIVLHDQLADRWLITQFSVTNRPPSHECVAVSQTPDPTGAYFLYDFVIPDDYFNDYPKLGVWPDAYYMTAPLFEGPVFGMGAFAMNRAKMLAGDPSAELIFFDMTISKPGLHRILPADVDGPIPPPPGTPNYMLAITAAELGDPQDGVRILAAEIDWSNPLASTIDEIPFAGGSLAVAAFDPTFTETSGNCGFAFTGRDDLEQPAPANCGMRLDALADRPLNRLAYRNSGSYESLVFVHTVDVNATPPTATSGHRAGVRYYELRRNLPGGVFAVQEQATFAPADAIHRWMGSGALDAAGNLAVGFSLTDATATFPAVGYAGRLAADPPGGLGQGEGLLAAGGRSQTSTGSRWGDYSRLSIDPADDCTFWFTQEYYDPTAPPSCSATACWTTRIASFKFPGCASSVQTGTLNGVVTELGTGNPLLGALVQANGYSTLTNAMGQYSMVIPTGTYTASATHSIHAGASASGLVVTNGGTTSQNFQLGGGRIFGQVTDSVSTNPIPGALVSITGGPSALTDAMGNYSIFLPPASYDMTVSADAHFSDTETAVPVGNITPAQRNFALVPAPVLSVTAVAVNDTSFGNSSGGIDPQECFTLLITLQNSGSIAATSVVGTLSTSTPGVTINGNVSPWPDIPAAGGGANLQPFDIRTAAVAQNAPISFSLSLSTSAGTIPLTFKVALGSEQQSPSATGPVAIPDNLGTGASLPINVAGFTGTLTKVGLRVRITHTFAGDLALRLAGPDGTVVTLSYQVGDASPGYGSGSCPTPVYTEFDDEAPTFIYEGVGPFEGKFKPQEPLEVFQGKTGSAVNGAWDFHVVDLGAVDTGNIECVELLLNGVVASSPCNLIFRDGFEVQSTLRWTSDFP